MKIFKQRVKLKNFLAVKSLFFTFKESNRKMLNKSLGKYMRKRPINFLFLQYIFFKASIFFFMFLISFALIFFYTSFNYNRIENEFLNKQNKCIIKNQIKTAEKSSEIIPVPVGPINNIH